MSYKSSNIQGLFKALEWYSTWVKVKNFPNPELFKLRSKNLQYAH